MDRICVKCVSDETFPNIFFDENGICSECKLFAELEKEFPTGENGKIKLDQRISSVKSRNKNSEFDVIVGVSGGRDSTYLMYYTKKILGLRVLAVHFNDGFGNPVAGENMKKASEILGIKLVTYTSNWKLSKNLRIAFLKANVPDIATPMDTALASALYAAAYNYNVKDIFCGQSFRTEGISPLEWNFLDGKYIETINQKYGNEKFPDWDPGKINFNLDLKKVFYYAIIKRIRTFFPYYYLDYKRDLITSTIEKECKWKNTGAHYFDDLYQGMMATWYREKFNIDRRKYNYSALIRSGNLSRDEALKKLKKSYIPNESEIVDLCLKRLGLEKNFFEDLIKNNHKKTFRDYDTSFNIIKKFKYIIKILSKKEIIPSSTYYKYFKY